MIQTLPLALPSPLVDHHALDLTALYSTGWGLTLFDLAGAANGEVYALYGVGRYTHGVADEEQDPRVANFGYRIITRYSAEGAVLASAQFRTGGAREGGSDVADGGDIGLCALPDGVLAITATPDMTTLVAPDLSRVLAVYDSKDGRPFRDFTPQEGDPFAGSISVTPSGRLLCTLAEYGVWRFGSVITNLVGIAEGALTAESKPAIRALASLDPEPAHQSAADLRPHATYKGDPIGMANRPRPALTELVAAEDRLSKWEQSRLGRPVPLSDDLFVVPFYARTFRSGSRGQPFVFALVNDQGEMTGRLHGLHEWRDSPFTGFCFNLAADPHRGHAFHLNRYGLYAWDRAGALRAKLDTGTKTFKPLTHFTLGSCAPNGDLLLAHTKQHLILRVPAPDDLTDLAATVEETLRAYARQRTALKKQWGPVNWHWQHSAPLHRI
ncbi:MULTISPECIES: hypothetical protein [Streptomyces]|uniref:hypothetical protein n=1 Tax=Streptomyces TaxID=1883 RepID=UPI001679D902|nr:MULTISPECIES: hypothetical protein [Streptomyces]MBD3580527.1 hypothetical protein [Streptomyces sp. KD18]GGT30285.1 hypothetical protein GCM10010286_64290 [Streptomyces toxytricini]